MKAPHGAVSYYWYSNNVVPEYGYNSRLQMAGLSAMTIDPNDPNNLNKYLLYVLPNWGATNHNGNLQGAQEAYGPLTSLTWLSQTYTYDTVNRLRSVTDTDYSRTFCSDAYGNTWVTSNTGVLLAGNTPQMIGTTCANSTTPYNAKNQINGASYDLAGNQTVVNGNTVAYDAENRQSSVTDGVTHAVETYSYDGDGRRVEKAGPNATVVYVYDALGQLAAEYSTANNTPSCTTCYLVWDHLGSTRLVTDQNAAVISRHDYLPFGEELGGSALRTGPWGSTTDVTQMFTGQERDGESNEDYFGARYYGSALGRFTSPDPGSIGAEPSDPQSWNAYSYAGNIPLSQTDPDGLDYHVCVNDGNGGQQCTNIASDQAFQQVAQNPGAGLSVSGDNGSGAIYATDENGNQVQVGTYQHFVGPGTEGGGLQQDFGTELAVAGIGARVMDAGAGLVQGLAGVFGRRAGTAAVEDAAAAAGNAFRVSINDVIQRAGSVVGNQQARVASEDVAKQAAEEFLGPGSREITQQYGNRAGQVVGRISADGQRVVRVDTNAAMPHYNFVNKTTSGNLHVYF